MSEIFPFSRFNDSTETKPLPIYVQLYKPEKKRRFKLELVLLVP